MITFMVSSLWHGFYACYHVMFFFTAITVELSKDMYRARILFRFIPDALQTPIAWVFSYIILDYLGTCVNALSLANVVKFVSATYGFVFIAVGVGFVLFRFCGLMKYARKLEQKKSGGTKVKEADSKPAADAKGETKKN